MPFGAKRQQLSLTVYEYLDKRQAVCTSLSNELFFCLRSVTNNLDTSIFYERLTEFCWCILLTNNLPYSNADALTMRWRIYVRVSQQLRDGIALLGIPEKTALKIQGKASSHTAKQVFFVFFSILKPPPRASLVLASARWETLKSGLSFDIYRRGELLFIS